MCAARVMQSPFADQELACVGLSLLGYNLLADAYRSKVLVECCLSTSHESMGLCTHCLLNAMWFAAGVIMNMCCVLKEL